MHNSKFNISPMPAELVSVIIPAYNPGGLLRRALDSVLAQTWRAFEVIVVDDGSTDDTATLCAEYADRVRYIKQPNRGVSVARNTGLRASRGNYVAFLDADNQWLPGFLETLMGHLAQHPEAGAATGAWFLIQNDGTEQIYPDPTRYTFDRVVDFLEACRQGPIFVRPDSAIFRKQAIVQVGGFCPWLRHNEDTEFIVRFSLRSLWYVSSRPLSYHYSNILNSVTFGRTHEERIAEGVRSPRLTRQWLPQKLFALMFMRKKFRRLAPSVERYRQYRRFLHHFYLSCLRNTDTWLLGVQLLYLSARNGFSLRWCKWALAWLARLCWPSVGRVKDS
jgi:glycosyltransferase involved in cell wall biosynthesis